MQLIFRHLTEKKFKFLTILVCFLNDIIGIKYLWDNKLKFYEKYYEAMDTYLQSQGQGRISENLKIELTQLLDQSMMIMFAGFLFIHLLIYTTHGFNKIFARYYILFLSCFGTLGCLTLVPSAPYFLINALGYAFVFYGLKFVFKTSEIETDTQ